MKTYHKDLTKGRWQTLSLAEQLANIGSEVSRAGRWQQKDSKLFWSAVERALELFYLTIADTRWKSRLKELTRLREIFCDAVLGGKEYGSTLQSLEQYFFYFALYNQKTKMSNYKGEGI
ncbi:MAG: hypothetical protein KJ887_01780 [Candidatus Omnitrophica bacterium]|nr:hypothetical protein [Candidatus Omnitrophota bacterium]MBU1047390.1 hypothetical protein [Candidatus Omnitrophota bacterium]MBU1630378.1 hypothetical protein [Candidatus Omnitrophota bacterium]MBU1766849.1 hypothetical protein [Candidatus Omnitrophota bacterium]MBU1889025.1 hypothetical protein [Candidatus Omnitrophota bacterium]